MVDAARIAGSIPSYQQCLPVLGEYLNQQRASRAIIAEVETGFLIIYFTENRWNSPVTLTVHHADLLGLQGAFEGTTSGKAGVLLRGGDKRDKKHAVCPMGFDVFFRALGLRLQRRGAVGITICDIGQLIYVGYWVDKATFVVRDGRRKPVSSLQLETYDAAGVQQLLKSTAESQAQEMTRHEKGLRINQHDHIAMLEAATLLEHDGNYREAEALLARIVSAVPQHPEAHYHIGRLALARGDRHGALTAAKKAAALQPGDPGVANLLGRALHRSNKGKEAVAALQRAISLDPDNGIHHYHLAKVYESLGQREEAEMEMQLSTVQLAAPAWDMVQEDIEEIEIRPATAAPMSERLPSESAMLPPAPDEVVALEQASVPSIAVPAMPVPTLATPTLTTTFEPGLSAWPPAGAAESRPGPASTEQAAMPHLTPFPEAGLPPQAPVAPVAQELGTALSLEQRLKLAREAPFRDSADAPYQGQEAQRAHLPPAYPAAEESRPELQVHYPVSEAPRQPVPMPYPAPEEPRPGPHVQHPAAEPPRAPSQAHSPGPEPLRAPSQAAYPAADPPRAPSQAAYTASEPLRVPAQMPHLAPEAPQAAVPISHAAQEAPYSSAPSSHAAQEAPYEQARAYSAPEAPRGPAQVPYLALETPRAPAPVSHATPEAPRAAPQAPYPAPDDQLSSYPASPSEEEGARPPSQGLRSPSPVSRPPSQGLRPLSQVLRPPSEGLRPPSQTSRPPSQVLRPVAQPSRPPSQVLRPPSQALRPASQVFNRRPITQSLNTPPVELDLDDAPAMGAAYPPQPAAAQTESGEPRAQHLSWSAALMPDWGPSRDVDAPPAAPVGPQVRAATPSSTHGDQAEQELPPAAVHYVDRAAAAWSQAAEPEVPRPRRPEVTAETAPAEPESVPGRAAAEPAQAQPRSAGAQPRPAPAPRVRTEAQSAATVELAAETLAAQRAVAADPSRADLHRKLGFLLARQGKTSEAAEEFRKALQVSRTTL